jgi:hypothetical protein
MSHKKTKGGLSMSGNGRGSTVSQDVDPVQDLDEMIRLINFLGKSKPGGFGATLGWVAERLQTVRAAVVQREPGR